MDIEENALQGLIYDELHAASPHMDRLVKMFQIIRKMSMERLSRKMYYLLYQMKQDTLNTRRTMGKR